MKDFLKLSLYQIIYHAVRCFPVRSRDNHLLLVKTDQIGDYVLLRNQLALFRQEGPYRGYHITFVGNSVFRQLFEQYDRAAADETIWLDKRRFAKNPIYRFRFLLRIRRARSSEAISLVHSRTLRHDDVFIAVSPANTRIAMRHDSRLPSAYENWLTPKHLYTQLIDSGDECLFDAIRNAHFVESLLHLPPATVSTRIAPQADVSGLGLPARFFVVFPGSGVPEKKWPAASFVAVTRHLAARSGSSPVVCGSAGDAADTAEFIRAYQGEVLDLTARTSLPQMLSVLSLADCLVSVDTGSVHLAAAVGCPVFGLFSGAHYGRFAPYPAEIAPEFYPIYPDDIDAIIRDGIPTDFEVIPKDGVRKIAPGKVIDRIDAVFSSTINKNSPVRERNS